MVNNSLTDEKKLVEAISVQTFWGIFNRVYTVEDGFSLELFRGKAYLGAILSSEITSSTKSRYQRLGLRNNDTILRINLGYRTLDVKCQLAMKDNWVRPYEGIVKIVVNNPSLFALQYQQESDPVALAKLAIEDAIKRYAQRTNYDAINDSTLRYEARLALLQGVYKNYGLEVVSVLASNISADPRKIKMTAIEQQGMINDVKIHVDADNALTKETLDQRLQRLKGENARDEDTLQKQHDRQQEFLDAASAGLKQIMLREISEGTRPEVLARRYPQFAQLLGFPPSGGTLPPAHEQALFEKGKTSDDASTGADSSIVTGNFTVVPQSSATAPGGTSAPQPFYSPRIGAWFIHTSLTDKQRQLWGVTYQIALMVYLLDADSVAEQGDLMPSDMVIEVNDQPLHSEKILLDILDTSLPGTQVSLRVLRGGLPYDLEFDIP